MDNQSAPLAEIMRPDSINDVVGHLNLIGKNEIIGHIINSQKPISLILWGPPGTGKTTIARIIAKEVKAEFIELSAVTSGINDVRKVIEIAKSNQRLGQKTILFVDEIHRFNKAQQDAFLPHVESGLIALIGATTENPSFEVISPLLSRTKVIELRKLTDEDIIKIIKRALKYLKIAKVPIKNIQLIAKLADGDARLSLGILELGISIDKSLSTETIIKVSQKPQFKYDKNGDLHFALISAFIKSLRGSDANASLYYLARMLQAGEDPKFIARRMIIFASEDIGLSASPALNLAVSTFLAVERLGMPECEYALYHCAIVLAGAKKSRLVADVMQKAKTTALNHPNEPVPLQLRNASTKFDKDLGYGVGYDWQANFKPDGGFLPDELKNLNLF
jgi:putative ATPase